jgi:hypothetical protein
VINRNGYVNPIALYGLNGSGKTGLLSIFKELHSILNASAEKISLFMPFIGEYNTKPNSEVELFFSFKGTDYTYKIVTSIMENKIVSEILRANSILLSRVNDEFKLEIDGVVIQKYGNKTKGSNYSILRQFGVEEYDVSDKMILVKYAFIYLTSIVHISFNGDITSSQTDSSDIRVLMVNKSYEVKKHLLSYNSFPVYDLVLNERKNHENTPTMSFYRDGEKFGLHEKLMSNGMESHSKLLTMMVSMDDDTLLVVDEIERSLHPFVARQMLEELNKNFNIQLIFSSHNTSLLQILRPDQIFFAKWDDVLHQSVYDKLSHTFPKIREINSIEKMYFNGSFDIEK